MSYKICFRFLLLIFVGLIFHAPEALACSCGPKSTVLDSYNGSDVVVVTRVVSVEKTENAAPNGMMSDGTNYVHGVKSTTMIVEKVFKGGVKAGDEMTFGQGGGADCIWTFSEADIGRRYLFYLDRFKDSTVWVAVTCGRSRGVDYANDDLLYLDNLSKVRGKTRISGTLTFDGANNPGVSGRDIRIVGAGKTYEVKTDENGVYELYDVPAGKYSVEPETIPGWRVGRFWLRYSPSFAGSEDDKSPRKIPIVLEAKKHAGLDIHFEIDNAVRGKIFDAESKPMNGVCLNLVPADGSKGPYLADCTEQEGTFEIDEIPPGRYVIVVNNDGEVTSNEPFGTFYYPNVAKREEATVFQIAAGEFVEDLQIYAPVAAEIITVEGFLLYSDGKPVAGESVSFKSPKTANSKYEVDARAETDAKGRFSIKILKDARGQLYGEMYSYLGKFENCPKHDRILKQLGGTVPELKTPAVEIHAQTNIYAVELRFPFPGCKKAKID